jgi:hypothetical protein
MRASRRNELKGYVHTVSASATALCLNTTSSHLMENISSISGKDRKEVDEKISGRNGERQ